MPVGYGHSEAGAAAAATAYLTVASEGLLLMEPAARDAAVRRMLVPDASADTVASVVGDPALLERIRTAASVVGQAPGGAAQPARRLPGGRLRPGAGPGQRVGGGGVVDRRRRWPSEAWTTTALELEWVDGDWRLWSLSSQDGPTPATTSGPVAGTEELIAALAGFSSYRYGPA